MGLYYKIEATRQMKTEENGYFEEEIVSGAVCSDCYHELDMGDDADIHVRTLYTGAIIELGEDDEGVCEHCGAPLLDLEEEEV